MRFFFALVLFIYTSCAFAQIIDQSVKVKLSADCNSYHNETETDSPLDDFEVVIEKDGKRERVIQPEASSDSVTFRLRYGHQYRLDIRRRGLCQKSISISTVGATPYNSPAGFTLVLNFTLHPDLNRAQKKLLREELLGKAAYDPVAEKIIFDFDYTKSMKAKLRALDDHPELPTSDR